MGSRLQIAVLVVVIGMGCLVAWHSDGRHEEGTVVFQGKPLENWFYGGRTNFFAQAARDSAEEALNEVGTNAFPFLLSQLKGGHGTPTLYNRTYRVAPGWLKSRLPYPLSRDDIRAIAFDHLRKLHATLSREQLETIAKLLPRLENPRLRMMGLNFLGQHYHPGFPGICRKFLEDPDPAIRLEAALPVAGSAIEGDPAEFDHGTGEGTVFAKAPVKERDVPTSLVAKVAAILLPALEQREIREQCVEINSYSYQQQPPGGSGLLPWRITSRGLPDQNEALRDRIKTALICLGPYLTAEQKAKLEKLRKEPTPSAPLEL